jgi:hypothetical protein
MRREEGGETSMMDPQFEPMSLQLANDITGGLSEPSKMPGYGYSLLPSACMTGSTLRKVEGSVCSKCYAHKGRYSLGTPQRCLEKRLKSITHPRWVEAMAFLINNALKNGKKFFRWHDAGDIQSRDHLCRIVHVCLLTPKVRHWLPTHEKVLVQKWLASGGEFPNNLTLRFSLNMIDELPPAPTKVGDGILFSTTHTQAPDERKSAKEQTEWRKVYHCPYQLYGNTCGPCRACWDKEVRTVSYALH